MKERRKTLYYRLSLLGVMIIALILITLGETFKNIESISIGCVLLVISMMYMVSEISKIINED